MKTITITGRMFRSSREAVRHAKAHGGRAVLLAGRRLVVSEAETRRLECSRASYAWLSERHGVLMTVPSR